MSFKNNGLTVLRGTIRHLSLENTTAEVFFRAGDQEGMAATGALAAAMGLSGIAAGMASMSTEETREPVTKATFDLDGKHIQALLWDFPFKEGNEVAVVAERSGESYNGFAVLDPKERIVVLYPHVTAGGRAHWKNVVIISSVVALIISIIIGLVYLYFCLSEAKPDFNFYLKITFFETLGFLLIFFLIGYRIGRRFVPFVKMAEKIFSILGWKDVRNINLRKISKNKRKSDDPPAMGDTYFRY